MNSCRGPPRLLRRSSTTAFEFREWWRDSRGLRLYRRRSLAKSPAFKFSRTQIFFAARANDFGKIGGRFPGPMPDSGQTAAEKFCRLVEIKNLGQAPVGLDCGQNALQAAYAAFGRPFGRGGCLLPCGERRAHPQLVWQFTLRDQLASHRESQTPSGNCVTPVAPASAGYLSSRGSGPSPTVSTFRLFIMPRGQFRVNCSKIGMPRH